jgi:PRC-barrel domain
MPAPSIDTVQSWQGRTLVDPAGDKLGTIDAIYLDDDTGQPEWATVTGGLFSAKTAFVPLAQAQATGDSVQVPYDKDQVTHAPNMQADGNLSRTTRPRCTATTACSTASTAPTAACPPARPRTPGTTRSAGTCPGRPPTTP